MRGGITRRALRRRASARGVAVLVLAGAFGAGCGARTFLDAAGSGSGGASSTSPGDAGADGEARDAPGADVVAADAEAPVPECGGENSQCVFNDAGAIVGSSIIKCAGVDFVGPWTLFLERLVGNAFQVVQTVVVEEPGFGVTIEDTTGQPAELTYRVCVSDAQGVRCGQPFTTYGPVDCACSPFTCEQFDFCERTMNDGCGKEILCGECPGGIPCQPGGSCCGPGFQTDGFGHCLCAPPVPCDWDWVTCSCSAG